MDILVSATQRAAMPSSHPGGGVLYASLQLEALTLEPSPFGLMRPKGMARTTTSCRKSETKLSLPMNNPALPHAKNASSRLNAEGRSARKKLPHFNPRNPLKSLDSDERIQGNPR
jgi:hypothetical protein